MFYRQFLIKMIIIRENVSWQSQCNTVGQTAGFFVGFTLFIVLESTKFCNQYIRYFLSLPPQEFGLVTLKSNSLILNSLKVM